MSVCKPQWLSGFGDPPWQGLAWPLASAILVPILQAASWSALCVFLGIDSVIFTGYLLAIGVARGIKVWRYASALRLARAAWRFRSLAGKQVIVRYDARVLRLSQVMTVLRCAEREFVELSREIGHMPRRKVTVFLLASQGHTSAVYGRDAIGFALAPFTVVVGNSVHVHETIRHELAHLFLGASRMPLLSEGFAVWWQGTRGGVPIDDAALPLLRRKGMCLTSMLDSGYFRDPSREGACYTVAGSFTGFLIRRLGWSGYLAFYREAARQGIARHFSATWA
jgi:hypothetical protein